MIKGNRVAIIVGINEYKDKNITHLTGAENDAKELYDLLANQKIGNFKISQNHFLLGAEATSDKIRKAVSDILWKTEEFDLVLLYFSGHGFVDSYGKGYIAPHEMIKNEPFVYGINMDELKDIISSSVNKKVVLMILDCCYSGILTKGDDKMSFERSFDMDAEGRITFASSGADKVSRENENCKHSEQDKSHAHGNFTSYLIDGLQGKADTNKDGKIDFEELKKYVENEMKRNGKDPPKFSTRSATSTENIIIAIAVETYEVKLNQIVSEIKDLCRKFALESLRKAVLKVDELKEIDSQNEDIIKFEQSIEVNLEKRRETIRYWLLANQEAISDIEDKTAPSLYKDLLDTIEFLKFADINSVDKVIFSLLELVSTYAPVEEGDLSAINYRLENSDIVAFQNNLVAKYKISQKTVNFITEQLTAQPKEQLTAQPKEQLTAQPKEQLTAQPKE